MSTIPHTLLNYAWESADPKRRAICKLWSDLLHANNARHALKFQRQAVMHDQPTDQSTDRSIYWLMTDWLNLVQSWHAWVLWVTNIPKHSYLEVGCSIIGHRPYLDMQVEQLHCVCVCERERGYEAMPWMQTCPMSQNMVQYDMWESHAHMCTVLQTCTYIHTYM